LFSAFQRPTRVHAFLAIPAIMHSFSQLFYQRSRKDNVLVNGITFAQASHFHKSHLQTLLVQQICKLGLSVTNFNHISSEFEQIVSLGNRNRCNCPFMK
jgi:hypothetical protein